MKRGVFSRETLPGDEAAEHFGVATACAGDLNNDGYPDLIIGAPEGTNLFAPGESFARVHTKKFQLSYRDPVGAGANFNLSDALSIQFCP